MAEAWARRRWPTAAIRSAGIRVIEDSHTVASEAVDAMKVFDIDVGDHVPTRISDVDLAQFDTIIALDKDVADFLSETYRLPFGRVLAMHIEDPFGSDFHEYLTCARQIRQAVRALRI